MTKTNEDRLAEALRESFAEVQRLRDAMFKVYSAACNGGDVIPWVEKMRNVMDEPWSGDNSRKALAAHEASKGEVSDAEVEGYVSQFSLDSFRKCKDDDFPGYIQVWTAPVEQMEVTIPVILAARNAGGSE